MKAGVPNMAGVMRKGPHSTFPATAHSSLAGLAWPGLASQLSTHLMALLYQLEQSQWWTAGQLSRHQLRQLAPLVQHALNTVPHYREHRRAWGIGGKWKLTAQSFAASLPILTRAEAQERGAALHAASLPKGHGETGDIFTSGSTGRPLRTLKTGLAEIMWQAVTLREFLWHRDLRLKLAVITMDEDEQAGYPDGAQYENWSAIAAQTFVTGPSCVLHVSTKIHQQVEWLLRMKPDYLFTRAGNAQALAQHCLRENIEFPFLRQVITFSDLLRSEARAVCREAWGVPVVDMYSAAEVGYIALQCPDSENYHIQSESVYVEILDEAGRRCAPGEVGQVIVTPLHNFAMPLLRYASGDLAEVGECACGRGLPALRRIIGRTRSVLALPNGEHVFPELQDLLIDLPMVRQFQILRRERESLDVKLVVARELTEGEAALLERELQTRFHYPFRLKISYHDELARSPSGKFHDFKDVYGGGDGDGDGG
ncbi:MAG: phenylacetate--CoA ligase family protein [Alphaproteobacteria bacterium]|nr:phenylacetate--CoA ligase family protein [Alphaproteobacteria bacterium]